ncbi:uncharacterized protein LOC124167667 [Ischnura elegans]|uniref:uncharacterized protein LOC124167667 n=1 Tax=Ischnura elegans TaxID=197161 RepID=UPI001ED8BE69|nr:uncharacterized protein LOC124167667 [Ischnura elegans]
MATIRPCDWEYIDRATSASGELLLNKEKERQKKKFDKLVPSRPAAACMDPKRLVINLSNKVLDKPTISVLSKGLNFAPAPSIIPYRDVIGGIEPAIRKLPNDLAEEVRSEVSLVLLKAIPPKPNTTREERFAIRALRNDNTVKVLPADKGNATVLLNTDDYHRKVLDILQDPAYRRLSRDPTDSITRKTIALIKKSGLPIEAAKRLYPPAPAPPKLYGVPKIHKANVPLRPIVSSIGAPTYQLARYLAGILSEHIGHGDHHIQNSSKFVKTIADMRLESTDIMVSFDVVSLFTRVPIMDTMELLKGKFDHDTVLLFHHALTTTYFKYNDTFYEQTDGVAMGSPLSPVIANFFMESFEEEALSSATLKPRCFYRYVDDTFIIWPHGRESLQHFLSHMNSRHANIQFTMEIEKDNRIPFLDILIHRKNDDDQSPTDNWRQDEFTGSLARPELAP